MAHSATVHSVVLVPLKLEGDLHCTQPHESDGIIYSVRDEFIMVV